MVIKSKDTVVVISGKDKGKQAKVTSVRPTDGKITVEGVAMVTKHEKARAQGQPGGIIHKEAYIDASNVMLVCPKCGKATRTGVKVLEDGKKTRVCKKCGAEVDK